MAVSFSLEDTQSRGHQLKGRLGGQNWKDVMDGSNSMEVIPTDMSLKGLVSGNCHVYIVSTVF